MLDCVKFGPVEADEVKFAEFREWAAGHPSMAHSGQVPYNYHTYTIVMNQLLQDVSKKARRVRHTIWHGIAGAQAAFSPVHCGVVMEPVGLWPDIGNPTADPPHTTGNKESNKAKPESAAQ